MAKRKGHEAPKLGAQTTRMTALISDTGPFKAGQGKAVAKKVRKEAGHRARTVALKDGDHVFIDGPIPPKPGGKKEKAKPKAIVVNEPVAKQAKPKTIKQAKAKVQMVPTEKVEEKIKKPRGRPKKSKK